MTSGILEDGGGQPLGEQRQTDGERRRTDSSRLLGRRSRSASWWTAEVGRQLASQRTAVTLGGRRRLDSGCWWTAVERQSTSRRTAAVLVVSGRSWRTARHRRLLEDAGNRPLSGRRRSNSSGSQRTAAVGLSLRGQRQSDGN